MRWALGLVLVLTALVYLVFPIRANSFDALAYALSVERGDLTHPHHLLHGVANWCAWRLANCVYPVRALTAAQTLNSLAAVLSLALLFRLGVRLGIRPALALWGAALLGVSYAWWSYAIEGETYILPVLCVLAGFHVVESFWGCGRRWPAPPGHDPFWLPRVLATAAPFALAACLHQTHVLSMPAVVLWLRARRVRWSAIVGIVFCAGLLTAALYYAVHVRISGDIGLLPAWRWSLTYGLLPEFKGAYGLPLSRHSLPAAVTAWGGVLTDEQGLIALRVALIEGLLVGFSVLALLRARREGSGAPVMALVAWLAAYGGFAFWWEPDDIEFLVPLGPALLLLAMTAGERWLRRHNPQSTGLSPTLHWVALGMVLYAFVINVRHIFPLHAAVHYARVERLILHVAGPNTVVVFEVPDAPYFQYFGGRALAGLRSPRWAMRYGTGTIAEYLLPLAARIDSALARGETVYTADFPTGAGLGAWPRLSATSASGAIDWPPTLRARFADPVRSLTEDELRSFYARYATEVVRYSEGTLVRLRERSTTAPAF